MKQGPSRHGRGPVTTRPQGARLTGIHVLSACHAAVLSSASPAAGRQLVDLCGRLWDRVGQRLGRGLGRGGPPA